MTGQVGLGSLHCQCGWGVTLGDFIDGPRASAVPNAPRVDPAVGHLIISECVCTTGGGRWKSGARSRVGRDDVSRAGTPSTRTAVGTTLPAVSVWI